MATVAGYLVSSTGRYKWTLLLGPIIAAIGLFLMSRVDQHVTGLELAPLLLLLGAGLGLVFPNLTLTVQNASSFDDLGIATSAANFFRSMGAAFGAAVAGVLLTSRLEDSLAERVGVDRLDEIGGAAGVIRSPKVVRDLPEELRDAAIEAVVDAVTTVIWLAVPLMVIVLILGWFVDETPLRTSSAIGGEDSARSDNVTQDVDDPPNVTRFAELDDEEAH